MKKICAIWKYFRLVVILISIPLIVVQILNPQLLDFSQAIGSRIFGTRADHVCQFLAVGGELAERIWKLREIRLS